MFTACVVNEPDTGETVWNAAHSYAVGDLAALVSTHYIYLSLASGIDAGSPDVTPLRWRKLRPTNKWAAFDWYKSTAIKYTGTLTMTVKPGIITDMAFFGLQGDTIRVVCKYAATGVVYYDSGLVSLSLYLSGDLEWEFWFGTPKQQAGYRISGLYPADAQVEITLTASLVTGVAAIGIWCLGSFAPIGSPDYGFTCEAVDYSRIKIDDYGDIEIDKGLNTTNLTGTCEMNDKAEAQAAADVVQANLGTPCAYVIVDDADHDYLNAFGLGSAKISPTNAKKTTLSLTVKGVI